MAQIYSYYYKPMVRSFLTEGESPERTMLFGFELEVEEGPAIDGSIDCDDFVEDDLTAFCEATFQADFTDQELLYFKEDGSLETGFEIVSQPMSWNWFCQNFTKFQDLLEFLQKKGFTSHYYGTCGLHIHCSTLAMEQNAFSNPNLASEQLRFAAANMNRILHFYKNEFIIFSRRKESEVRRWCQFLSSDSAEESQRFTDRTLRSGNTHERYHVLNLINQKTLEVRLMRGTLNWKTFFCTFNLIKNLAQAAMMDETVVRFHDLMTDGLDPEMARYAEDYFEKQKGYSYRQGLPLRSGACYTMENGAMKQRLIRMNLERFLQQ